MVWLALAPLLAAWLLFVVLALLYFTRGGEFATGRLGRILGERISAERRAQSFMRELLTPHQYQQLTHVGFVEVPSPAIPDRVYRIPGSGGLVRVYEQGHAIMDLCLQPAESLPDGDVVLLHKLMIEGNEQEYLAKANHFAPGIITLRCGYM